MCSDLRIIASPSETTFLAIGPSTRMNPKALFPSEPISPKTTEHDSFTPHLTQTWDPIFQEPHVNPTRAANDFVPHQEREFIWGSFLEIFLLDGHYDRFT